MADVYGAELAALVQEWAHEPTETNLAALQDAIQGHWNYSPAIDVTRRVLPLVDSLRHRSAYQELAAAMPGGMLSPSIHGLLARTHQAMGDRRGAERETWLMHASVRAIVESGDGSRERPYVVLRHADRQDFCDALGIQVSARGVEQVGGRLLDRCQCADGQLIYFTLRQPVA